MLDLLSRFSLTAALGLILIAGVAVSVFERQWIVVTVMATIISNSSLLFVYTYHRRLLATCLMGVFLFFAATDRASAVTTLIICVAWKLFEFIAGSLFTRRKNV